MQNPACFRQDALAWLKVGKLRHAFLDPELAPFAITLELVLGLEVVATNTNSSTMTNITYRFLSFRSDTDLYLIPPTRRRMTHWWNSNGDLAGLRDGDVLHDVIVDISVRRRPCLCFCALTVSRGAGSPRPTAPHPTSSHTSKRGTSCSR